MIYAVRHPVALLGLLAGFLVGVLVHGMVQAWLAARLGDRAPAMRGQTRPDLRAHLDPFGAVGVVIGGVGWGKAVLDTSRLRWRRGRLVAVAVAGPLANFALGAAALVAFVAVGAPRWLLGAYHVNTVLHGVGGLASDQAFALSFGVVNLAMGVLSFVPLPPLEGAVVMFRLAPRTRGWQLAQYRLVEQNWGLAALLLLVVLPLTGNEAPLIALIDAVVHPVLSAVGGG